MKTRTTALNLVMIIVGSLATGSAFAHGGGYGHGGGWGHGGGYGHGGGWGHGGGHGHGGGWGHGGGHGHGGGYHHGNSGCSPEVKQNVVSVAERALHEAAISDDFKDAAQFKTFVNEAEKIQNTEEKLHTYFSVVGVDSRSADAVAEFIGARDHAVYRTNAEKAMGLTPGQSEILVNKLSGEILSAINK